MTGSMYNQTADTIGGFNAFIKEQKEVPGECRVSCTFFNSENTKRWLVDLPLEEVPDLTDKIYRAGGNTPLYDAIGNTIEEVGTRLAATPEEDRPERVLVMIMTDGEENWSKEYSLAEIIEMIARQRQEFSWEFIFLGADLDSFGQGAKLGIQHAVDYGGSTSRAYSVMSCAARSVRTSGKVEDKDL